MIDVRELRQRIEGMYAEPFSEEGQAEIHDPDNSHVVEVWEDGEVTSTKCGELYQQRRIHGKTPPFLPEGQVLFGYDEVDDDTYEELRRRKSHKRMVVVDRELLDILAEYREFVVDKAAIEECGQRDE